MICGDTSSCNGSGSCSGAHIWSRSFGGPGDDRIVGVEPTPDGGYILAGNFAQSIDFGSGPLTGTNDIFVAKLDAMGNEVWSKRFGDADVDGVQDVAVSADGSILLTGFFEAAINFGVTPLSTPERAIFLVKLNTDGNETWAKGFSSTLSTTSTQGQNVAVDPASGDVHVSGTYMGSVSLGGATLPNYNTVSGALFLARFSSAGAYEWSDTFGSNGGGVSVVRSALRPDGSYVTACNYYGTLNFGGSTFNGGVAIAAFSSNGSHLWSENYTSDLLLGDIAAGPTGQVTMTGAFVGTASFGGQALMAASPTDIDMFVGRFDLLGQHAWSISNGGLGNDDDASGVSDGALGVFVAGRFGSTVDIDGSVLTSAGAEDALVLGLDQGGGLEWGVRAGDAGEQEATVIAQSTTAVVVGGAFTSGIELGDGATLSSNGGRDVFVALLAP